MSITDRPHPATDRVARARGDGRAPVARRRRAPVALPAGAHAGQEEGKETISSQELSDYTHVNSTQIRRDLSGFGKFGKRGVGYNVDSLVSQIRKILRTAGQHNIALFGAGHLGRAIASSDIFADHGFRVVAIFDADPRRSARRSARRRSATSTTSRRSSRTRTSSSASSRCPTAAAQALADAARRRRREDHLQLLRGAAAGAAGGHGPHLEPRRRPALRAVLLPDVSAPPMTLDLDRAEEAFAASTDCTVGLEEEFADPRPGDARPRAALRGAARRRAAEDPALRESIAGELISSEIEIRSGRGEDLADARRAPARRPPRGCSRSPPRSGVALGATGTHPWADYREQPNIDTEHYRRVVEGLQYVARRNNTFSLHVHVGVRDADRAVRVCDRLRPVLPMLLALSANSPFLDAPRRAACTRRARRSSPRRFPRCGVPDAYGSWAAYRDYIELLDRARARSSSTRRCGGRCARTSRFGTVEVRICDAQADRGRVRGAGRR